jgi:hypothetical protein
MKYEINKTVTLLPTNDICFIVLSIFDVNTIGLNKPGFVDSGLLTNKEKGTM